MLAVAAALPVVALLAWLFATQVRTERGEARDTAMRIAKSAAGEIRALHAESTALLNRMATRPTIRDAAPGRCDALFAIVDFFPQYLSLMQLDRGGGMICSAVPQAGDHELALHARRWVESEVRAGRLQPAQPQIRPIDGRWVSALASPVMDGTGSAAGLLVLIQLPDLGLPPTLPAGSVVTVIDAAGTILGRSADAERWVGRTFRGTEVTELVLQRREGRGEARGVDGVSRQYGFTHLPEIGWFIYAGVPTHAVMEPVRELYLRGAVAGGVILALAVVAALMLSRFVQRPIDALARAASSVSREGYTTRVPVDGPLEIKALGEAFNEMVESRSKAEARIVASERTLKALSDRLLTIQEEERTRIAREIHDELGQALTALKMDVGGLLRLADTSSPAVSPVRERIVRTLDSTVEAVQRIAAELRPSVLDDLGLVAAIESEARMFEERTGIEVDLSLPASGLALDGRTESAVYRMVQEALTNVARHSEASRLEIRLRVHPGELLLEVRDDGRGIRQEQTESRSSLGLIGMRERAAVMGGSVHFEGIEGRGTIVSVRIPVKVTP